MRAMPLLAATLAMLVPLKASAEPPVLTAKPVAIVNAGAEAAVAPPSSAPAETRSAPATEAKPAPAVVVVRPRPPSLIAKINLTTQRLELHTGGRLTESWAISSGREEFPTPRGVFRPQWASKLWFSKKYDNAPMPHAVFFTGGVAVHATESTGLLGQPASHGCVRLAPAHAARFYALVHSHGFQNTRIEVFGTPPPPRIAQRHSPSTVRIAGSSPGPKVSNAWGGWSQPMASPSWAAGQRPAAMRQASNGLVYLPAGSPHQGAKSFVQNGIVYVRVR